MEASTMKKQDKRATKRKKQPLKDLRAKTASPVRGGAVATFGRLKYGDIELKSGG